MRLNNRIRLLFLAVLLMALLITGCDRKTEDEKGPQAVAEGIDVAGVPRITICHFTGANALPYVEISVSNDAATRHQAHPDDLIPAPEGGCPTQVADSTTEPVEDTAALTSPEDEATMESPEEVSVATPTLEPLGTSEGVPMPSVSDSTQEGDTTQAQTCTASENMLAVIESNPSLSRFSELIDQAGVGDIVAEFPLTVFAPTDEAFAQIDDNDLEDWTADEGALNAFVLYHMVMDPWAYGDLEDLIYLETLSGELITITVEGDTVLLNDTAKATQPDESACNSVLHVIDGVLVPPIFTMTGGAPSAPPVVHSGSDEPELVSLSGDSGSAPDLATQEPPPLAPSAGSGTGSSPAGGNGDKDGGSTSGDDTSTDGSTDGSTTTDGGTTTDGDDEDDSETPGSSDGSDTTDGGATGGATGGTTDDSSTTGGDEDDDDSDEDDDHSGGDDGGDDDSDDDDDEREDEDD